jgi:GNAT superfamily N-acetyltransferase
MVAKIACRAATPDDIPLLARHHRMMFEEMRSLDANNLPRDSCCGPVQNNIAFPLAMAQTAAPPAPDFDRLEATMAEKLTLQMKDGSCIAWIAFNDNTPVASGGVSIISTVPVPEDPSLEIAFLHSVFTEKNMRGQGIASMILDKLLAHCKNRGIKRVQLNASDAGQRVYQKKGFQLLDRVMLCWL